MSSEIKQTPRNKARAEYQFAEQIVASGLPIAVFITRVGKDGIVYQTKGQTSAETYTKANAPVTFAWFLEIIASLTPSQINELASAPFPVSGNVATGSSVPPSTLPTQNTEILSTEPPVVPQPTIEDIPSNTEVPAVNQSSDPTPAHNQETLPTEPPIVPHASLEPSHNSEVSVPEPTNQQGTLTTEPSSSIAPSQEPEIPSASPLLSLPNSTNATEDVPPANETDDTVADPTQASSDSSKGGFFKSMPFFLSVAGTIAALALGTAVAFVTRRHDTKKKESPSDGSSHSGDDGGVPHLGSFIPGSHVNPFATLVTTGASSSVNVVSPGVRAWGGRTYPSRVREATPTMSLCDPSTWCPRNVKTMERNEYVNPDSTVATSEDEGAPEQNRVLDRIGANGQRSFGTFGDPDDGALQQRHGVRATMARSKASDERKARDGDRALYYAAGADDSDNDSEYEHKDPSKAVRREVPEQAEDGYQSLGGEEVVMDLELTGDLEAGNQEADV